jgi:hypothetical protein
MAKKPVLTPDEKYALKYLKELQKKGKPGDVQKRLDRLDSGSKDTIASAIKKTKPASRAAKVNKPAKQATPTEIKVRGRSSGKLKTIKIDSTPRRGGGLRGMLGGGGGMNRTNR